MNRINMGRVILGGLAAGLIINVGEAVLNLMVLGQSMNDVLTRLNLPPVAGSAMAAFTILGFALGIAMVWLYATIRPRFGAGVSTALIAGAMVYFFAYLYPNIGLAMMGFFPARLIAIALAWGLVEVLVAAVAGAWLYQEEAPPAAVRV